MPTTISKHACDVHKCTNSIHNVFEVCVHVFVCNVHQSSSTPAVTCFLDHHGILHKCVASLVINCTYIYALRNMHKTNSYSYST